MNMTRGDVVKYIDESPDEKAARESGITMTIVWIDPPRAMLKTFIPGWTIPPTHIVNIDEIEKVTS